MSERNEMTAGPWYTDGTNVYHQLNPGGRKCLIAMVAREASVEQVKANARGLAALPELVEALRMCLEAIDCIGAIGETPSHYVDMANAKLAKAYSTGQAILAKVAPEDGVRGTVLYGTGRAGNKR